MSVTTFIVDAFTSHLFKGNQAAVCVLTEDCADSWLQQVAAEFNLSETAFIRQIDGNRWQLRWFTPQCEIKLCGHATLASAHVLINELQFPFEQIIFSTLSGDLYARAKNGKITLDFPRTQISFMTELNREIAALAQDAKVYTAGEDLIIEMDCEQDVLHYEPNIEKIAATNVRGIIITAPADQQNLREFPIDFVSRFFAPNVGIYEDPVTGSAHCALASLWSEKLDKQTLMAMQLSARTGLLEVICHEHRVELIGSCVTFLKGTIGQCHN